MDYQDEFGSPSDIETSPREDEEETERRRAAAGEERVWAGRDGLGRTGGEELALLLVMRFPHCN